jgi:adenylate cyclase
MARRARNVPLWTAIAATLVACLVSVVHVRGKGLPGLAGLEGLAIDMRFKMRGAREPATDRIVIVGIDDETHGRGLTQTRRGYAQIVDAIAACKPKLIALDFFFQAPEELLPPELAGEVKTLDERMRARELTGELGELRGVLAKVADELRGDDKLAASIANAKTVVLGAYFFEGALTGPADEPPGLKAARLGQVADGGGGDPVLRPIQARSVQFTRPEIAKGAIGAGAVNDLRDSDGVRRRMPLVVEYGGKHYLTLGLAMALAELGRPRDVTFVVGDASLKAADVELSLGRASSLQLDWLGPGKLPRVGASQLLDGKSCDQVAGKLAFVGVTYAAYDKVLTPLDPVADGVELHATVAENVLGGHLLHGAGWATTVISTLLLCAVVCAAQLRRIRRRAWMPPLLAIGAIGIYVVVALALFERGLVIAMAAPVVLTGAVLLAAMIGGLATEGREKAYLRGVFGQYVSEQVVDRLIADPSRARLGGERKELTVLFSDIRGFSQVAEGLPPEELAAFLGEYLSPMTDLVLASGGTLDKYIGDAVMAQWGAPIDIADHAARACEVALRMHETLVELNRGWRAAGKREIAIGIGINTGPMAVGNMGSTARFEYTVLGDNVNLGSRLEALTKEYGVGILVGEATAKAAGDRFVFREIDRVRVKGRATAAPVFELVGRAGTKLDPAWAAGLALYRAGKFVEARQTFVTLDEPAAKIMTARCEVLAADPPEDWDGVYEQRSK